MNRVVRWVLGAGLAATIAGGAGAQGQSSESEAFLAAIREKDGAKADTIIGKQGPSVVNYRGYNGDTPLTVAMASRNTTYVNYLIGKGAQPDLPDKRGDTPLIIAARSGFSEGIVRMLAAKANVNAANRQGETALIVAVQQRQTAIVKLLLAAGADADKADFAAGYSARDYARRDTRSRELSRMIETIKPAKKSVSGPIRF